MTFDKQSAKAGTENTEYIDSTDNDKKKLQKGPLRISGEVDRDYINTENDCFISDSDLNRTTDMPDLL